MPCVPVQRIAGRDQIIATSLSIVDQISRVPAYPTDRTPCCRAGWFWAVAVRLSGCLGVGFAGFYPNSDTAVERARKHFSDQFLPVPESACSRQFQLVSVLHRSQCITTTLLLGFPPSPQSVCLPLSVILVRVLSRFHTNSRAHTQNLYLCCQCL